MISEGERKIRGSVMKLKADPSLYLSRDGDDNKAHNDGQRITMKRIIIKCIYIWERASSVENGV